MSNQRSTKSGGGAGSSNKSGGGARNSNKSVGTSRSSTETGHCYSISAISVAPFSGVATKKSSSSSVTKAPKYNGPDLYHYTNAKGAAGIDKTGQIKSTRNPATGDMLLGAGVYATSKKPSSSSKTDILYNNYGGENSANASKADYYYKIPRDVIQHELDNGGRVVRAADGDRDVWVVKDAKDVQVDKRMERQSYY